MPYLCNPIIGSGNHILSITTGGKIINTYKPTITVQRSDRNGRRTTPDLVNLGAIALLIKIEIENFMDTDREMSLFCSMRSKFSI